MLLLVLGRGKTGSMVAEVAAQHGHSVRVVGEEENRGATALNAPFLACYDVVIDFTTPEAAVANMRACLANGARVVVGTTGWYQHLDAMRSLAERRGAGLLYGTNFSVGVQAFFRAARALALALPHYAFAIEELHHASKQDKPSGTALTLKQVIEAAAPAARVEITSKREGEHAGLHTLLARSADDAVRIEHEASSRRGFAEGAVRAAEWLAGKQGTWDFAEIAAEIA